MGLFLFRFWPVLVPLLIYWLWWLAKGRAARKAGEEPPRFSEGPLYWAVLASLLTAAGCFFILGLSMDERKGAYIPPHMEGGALVPGRVVETSP